MRGISPDIALRPTEELSFAVISCEIPLLPGWVMDFYGMVGAVADSDSESGNCTGYNLWFVRCDSDLQVSRVHKLPFVIVLAIDDTCSEQ